MWTCILRMVHFAGFTHIRVLGYLPTPFNEKTEKKPLFWKSAGSRTPPKILFLQWWVKTCVENESHAPKEKCRSVSIAGSVQACLTLSAFYPTYLPVCVPLTSALRLTGKNRRDGYMSGCGTTCEWHTEESSTFGKPDLLSSRRPNGLNDWVGPTGLFRT